MEDVPSMEQTVSIYNEISSLMAQHLQLMCEFEHHRRTFVRVTGTDFPTIDISDLKNCQMIATGSPYPVTPSKDVPIEEIDVILSQEPSPKVQVIAETRIEVKPRPSPPVLARPTTTVTVTEAEQQPSPPVVAVPPFPVFYNPPAPKPGQMVPVHPQFAPSPSMGVSTLPPLSQSHDLFPPMYYPPSPMDIPSHFGPVPDIFQTSPVQGPSPYALPQHGTHMVQPANLFPSPPWDVWSSPMTGDYSMGPQTMMVPPNYLCS